MSCPDCFSGSFHDGKPRGNVIKAYGLDAYVTGPLNGQQAKGVVVMIPDAFGWEFVNIRLLADKYAEMGDFKVYVPDFMNGHAAPIWMLSSTRAALAPINILIRLYNLFWALCGFIPFILYNRPNRVYPVAKGFFGQLRKEEGGTLSIGAAGFCWGGELTLLLAQGVTVNGRPLIDAAFTGHPSLLSLPGDVEKLTVPVSFAIGDEDTYLSVAEAETIKAVVEAKPESARGEVRIYPDAGHGFCVRADTSCEDIAKQASEADEQCISWFNAHFKIAS